MSYLNPRKISWCPAAVTGSLSIRTFDCSGDITQHKKYCDGQLPPPKQSEFHCRVLDLKNWTNDIVRSPFLQKSPLLSSDKLLKVKGVCECVCVCV